MADASNPIAFLVVGNVFGRFLVAFHSRRSRQILCGDPGVDGLANLLDGQVQTVGRFFL